MASCAAGTTCAADNILYDGNNYQTGGGPRSGQWSLGRGAVGPDPGDTRNPVEAIHLDRQGRMATTLVSEARACQTDAD